QVDRNNVQALQLQWVWALGEGATNQLAPVVHDGVMYLYNPNNRIQALDATDGELIWEYSLGGRTGTMRGLALYENKLITNTPDGNSVALDARNGELLWTAAFEDGDGNTSSPMGADSKVFTGMINCMRFRPEKCYVSAWDANDGKLLWKFETVARAGTPGGDTWGGIDDMFRAGTDTWITPSYDAEAGVVYIGVSQPKPWMP